MHELAGKWVQIAGQPLEGLWFEFEIDGSFIAEYAPMGITSSGKYEVDGDLINIDQTQHTLNLTGEFNGRFTIEGDRLLLALAASPGESPPEDLSGARIYQKEE